MSNTNREENIAIALESTQELPNQWNQAWQESREIEFADNYRQANNLVVCGMGGSALGAYILRSGAATSVPLTIVEDYDLPAWANEKTLVVLSSYSGDTQETLSCANQAKKLGCLVTGITSGGELGQFLADNRYPHYLFAPKFNPSDLPRFGVGYTCLGLAGITDVLGFTKIGGEIDSLALPDKESVTAMAKRIAVGSKGKMLVIFSSGHLDGNGHTMANQINETAKTLAFWSRLPDVDHYLVEGVNPREIPVAAVFLTSRNYRKELVNRHDLTKKIFDQAGRGSFVFQPTARTTWGEILETLWFSGFASLFLAGENGVDPLLMPAINFIKSQLETP